MLKSNYFLTIDVGTVNLAYCLAEYKTNIKNGISNSNSILKSIDVIKWGILDVSYKPLYCKQIKNKRAICNCISKFYTLKNGTTDHSNPENLIGYCKSHVKPLQVYNKVNKKDKIKVYKISENPIYKNNFNIQMERLLFALEKFYLEVLSKPYDIDETGNPKYISNLKIYIENQPVFKNPVMKTISIGIFTFFSLKKVTNNIVSNVNFINATVKTKDDFISKLFELIEVKSYINKFKDYDKRKEFTIDITNQICPKLNNSINNIVSINNYDLNKKKDDMADTLVYVIYIIIYLL